MTETRLLGAIIAGGSARRFGRDKAAEQIAGVAMLDHVVEAIRPQVRTVVICGKNWRDLERIDDRPAPGLGPLGGLNAALRHAQRRGFIAVLSAPVDVLPLPGNLVDLLGGTHASVFERQYLIGYWPIRYAPILDAFLAEGGRAVREWLDIANAARVREPTAMTNINRREDLDRVMADKASG